VSAVGPPLKFLHPDVYGAGLALLSINYWRTQTTDAILRSLLPGSPEALRVKSDSTIMNGNTRLMVLLERQIDIDALPRETHR
jgi:hypothetical protein